MNSNRVFPPGYSDWLSACGNGRSVPAQYIHDDNDFSRFTPEFGIQQNENEIMEFLNLTSKLGCQSILEIGLGYFGSTHYLFKYFFDHVTTVEFSIERTRSFFSHLEEHEKSFIPPISTTGVIIGDSINPLTLLKVTRHMNNIGISAFDCLFIDGYHSLEYVMGDHQLYSPLVKKGGIVAFHDSLSPMHSSGVKTFLNMLENGFANLGKVTLERIEFSKNLGIAFYRKVT